LLKNSLHQKIDDKIAHMITFVSNVTTWLEKGPYWLHIHVLVMDAMFWHSDDNECLKPNEVSTQIHKTSST
jgi:hypothetical protein